MAHVYFIDLEASGLHFNSYPIEVAITNGIHLQSWLIAPEPTWTYWDENAERLHGITREQLRREGASAAQVAGQLSKAMAANHGIVYSDAAAWDLDWIRTLYFAAGDTPPFHIASVYDLLTQQQSRAFRLERRRLEQSGEFRLHRAGPDAMLLSQAFRYAIQEF